MTKATLPRTDLTSVKLTDRERLLIVLYRSCPEPIRLEVGSLLFNRWREPSTDQEKNQGMKARWTEAMKALRTGNLMVDVFDELTGDK